MMKLTGYPWLDFFLIVGAVSASIGGVIALLRPLFKAMHRINDFLDTFQKDWLGVPDRPGVPGRRGVMERIAVIEAELSMNHGKSVKDTVTRLDQMFIDHIANNGNSGNGGGGSSNASVTVVTKP